MRYDQREEYRRQKAVEALKAYKRYGSITDAAKHLGVPRTTLAHRIHSAELLGINLDDPPDEQLRAAKERIYELESELKMIKADSLTDEYVKKKIIGLRDAEQRIPDWVVRHDAGKPERSVPVALWSDWHIGEVVEATQVNGLNEFNMAVAHRRVRTLVEKTIHLLTKHIVNPTYPGIVINLGGDLVTGDIHDELSQTNEVPIMPAVIELYGMLIWAIRSMADAFGKVFVPCVTGNHGRTTRKPRAKGRNYTNYEWLIYHLLKKVFEDDDRVRFLIPDGPDAMYNVYGTRFALTHGDQFRGGDGYIGAVGPIVRGHKRKLARNAAIGMEYDVLLMGHWHSYMVLPGQITNGSLLGYSEYANSLNLPFELPVQAMWLVHPRHGITFHLPVHLEESSSAKRQEWVSWGLISE